MITHSDQFPARLTSGISPALWLWWIAVCTAGGILVGALFVPGDFFVHLIARGFILGAAQWLVLRRYLPGALWWILATGLGLIIASMISTLPPISDVIESIHTGLYERFGLWEVFWINPIREAVIWGLVGVGQWIVLRRYPGAAWWIPLSVVGGAVLGVAAATTCYVVCDELNQLSRLPLPTVVTNGVSWALYGVVTGWLLLRIFSAEKPQRD
jgi:hypothetical protein